MAENNQDRTKNEDDLRQADQNSQSQNNNGNIGRDSGVDRDGNGSFKNISKDINQEKPVNEEGIAENEEQHWTGNYGQKRSDGSGSREEDGFRDKNISNASQQNSGRNHVTNVGGTSQEDLVKGKTGLTDEENES